MIIKAIYPLTQDTEFKIPFVLSRAPAGFPSPAEDFEESKLDLNEYLIKHPAATFFIRVQGDSMENAGIFDEDILIVDRALEPQDNSIVVAILNGEFTVKRIKHLDDKFWLEPENPNYESIPIHPESDFQVWGVVSYVIHKPK